MLRRVCALALLCLTLGSCSYVYDILAIARHGRVEFIVDPDSDHDPSCLRQIEVLAEGSVRAQAALGDDASRVGYGTFWFESVDYDDACANKFPVTYGATLQGTHQQDRGTVRPKELLREVVYEVSTTTGATGYGGGRFVIHADGRIENLQKGQDPSSEASPPS